MIISPIRCLCSARSVSPAAYGSVLLGESPHGERDRERHLHGSSPKPVSSAQLLESVGLGSFLQSLKGCFAWEQRMGLVTFQLHSSWFLWKWGARGSPESACRSGKGPARMSQLAPPCPPQLGDLRLPWEDLAWGNGAASHGAVLEPRSPLPRPAKSLGPPACPSSKS